MTEQQKNSIRWVADTDPNNAAAIFLTGLTIGVIFGAAVTLWIL